MNMTIILIGAGGALGAICRYLLSLVHTEGSFPWMTFATNLIGAFLIGLIVASAEKHGLSSSLVLFLKTGFCGGFTTFSTFSLETFNLLEHGHAETALIYAGLSLGLCVLGVWLGEQSAMLL